MPAPPIHKTTSNMANYRDIEVLEERIYEVVQEFIDNVECYEHPMMKITRKPEGLVIDIVECEEKFDTGDEATYSMWDLVLTEQDGTPVEPNIDEINEVANQWIFLD